MSAPCGTVFRGAERAGLVLPLVRGRLGGNVEEDDLISELAQILFRYLGFLEFIEAHINVSIISADKIQ